MAARCTSCGALLNPRAHRCAVCDAPVATVDPATSPVHISSGGMAVLPADELSIAAELGKALAPSIHLKKRIGRGGMGIVFLARDESLKRDVAIKVLAPDLAGDPTTRTRFIREAEAAAAVSHPNIVNIYHVGLLPQSEVPYFVMQYIEGPSMADAAGRMLPEARVRRVIGEVASGLAAAHRRGVVHRDIKPGNIVIDGETGRALLLDFGISAAVASHPARRSDRLTTEGSYLGTPAYMSPELASGDEAVDKSDVYSLGVVAYELLTGKPPFPGQGLRVMAAHVNDELPDLHHARADLSPEIVELVERSLAKNPVERPSAQSIVDHLLPGSRQALEWPPPGLAPLRRTSAQFRFGLVALVLTTAAFLISVSARPVAEESLRVGARATAYFESARQLALSALPAKDAAVDNVLETEAVWAAAAYATFALLLLATCFVAVQSVPTLHGVRMARRSGYPWSTIADVMSDMRRDGGDLMSGLSVYAFSTERERNQLLRMRRLRLVGILLAAILAAASMVAWVNGWFVSPAASDRTHGSIVPVWLFIVPVLVLGASAVTAGAEAVLRRRRAQADEEWQGAHLVKRELVASWVVSAGRKFSGSTGLSRLPIEVIAGAALVMIVAASLIIANAGMRAAIRAAAHRPIALGWASSMADSAYATAWKTRDSILARSTVVLTRGAPAIDQKTRREFLASFVAPSVGTHQLIARRPEDSILYAGGPNPVSAEALAVWRTVARGAPLPRFWPFQASRELDSIAPNHDALQSLASANLRDGMTALANGDSWAAELRARENLSVGRQLIRAGTPEFSLIGALTSEAAFVLDSIARLRNNNALVDEAAAIRSLPIFERPVNPHATALFTDPSYRPILRLVADTLMEPSVRVRLAQMSAAGFCENPREVLFGVAPARFALTRQAMENLSDLEGARALVAPWEAWLLTSTATGTAVPTPPVASPRGKPPKRAVAFATTLFRLDGLRSRLMYCSLG